MKGLIPLFYSDYHIHTSFSSDCETPASEMIEKAISLGLKEIAITDHIDFDYPNPEFPFLLDYEQYALKIHELQMLYKDKITIRFGTEIGLQPHILDDNKEFIKTHSFDFIIGSTHCVDKFELYGNSFFEGKTQKQAYREYFEDVLKSIQSCDFFDVYGHIDYINRYGDYADNTLYLSDYTEIIEEIVKSLVQRGIGLEINTSGFKYGMGYAHPQISILKRYHDLGGEIVTIGSDSHTSNFIASHFKEAYQLLEQSGFGAFTIFENRKPSFVNLSSLLK